MERRKFLKKKSSRDRVLRLVLTKKGTAVQSNRKPNSNSLKS